MIGCGRMIRTGRTTSSCRRILVLTTTRRSSRPSAPRKTRSVRRSKAKRRQTCKKQIGLCKTGFLRLTAVAGWARARDQNRIFLSCFFLCCCKTVTPRCWRSLPPQSGTTSSLHTHAQGRAFLRADVNASCRTRSRRADGFPVFITRTQSARR